MAPDAPRPARTIRRMSSRTPSLLALTLVAALLTALPRTALAADAVRPLAPSEPVAGVPQAELSQRWWQWAFSFERARSPIADRTGQLCASRQAGEVWFLAGTYGTQRVERSCRVPHGKLLFFPLINYVTFRAEGGDEPCSSLVRRAALLTQAPSGLLLDIDGQRMPNLQAHRLVTGCFSLVPGEPADAAANGYYVALPPLPRGEHLIEFGGILPSMAQAVTYRLTVD